VGDSTQIVHVVDPTIAKCVFAEGVGARLRCLGRSGWIQAMCDQHHGDDFRGRHERVHLELGEKSLCSFICRQASGLCDMIEHEGLTHQVDLA